MRVEGACDGSVVYGLEDVAPASSVVTVGKFDGVHRGHQVLVRRAVHAASDLGVRSVAVTFDPHPAAVVRPGSEPHALQTLDERVTLLMGNGVDLVVVLPFTAGLAESTPQDFVRQVLVERLQASRVVIGADFRFGRRASGDLVALAEEGERFGFDTEATNLLDLDGAPISSSSVRERLASGDVDWVTRALGRVHTLSGKVIRGEGRGSRLGIPTATLDVPDGLALPADGVYVGEAVVDGCSLRAVTNIGVRPTFDGEARTVEVHLLDAELDLHGRHPTVGLEQRIRRGRQFEGIDQFVEQICADIKAARSTGDDCTG